MLPKLPSDLWARQQSINYPSGSPPDGPLIRTTWSNQLLYFNFCQIKASFFAFNTFTSAYLIKFFRIFLYYKNKIHLSFLYTSTSQIRFLFTKLERERERDEPKRAHKYQLLSDKA